MTKDLGGIAAVGGVLDVLCPMHAIVDATGHIRHAGPALQKLSPGHPLAGTRLMEVFELRRPRASGSMASLIGLAGLKLHFSLRQPPRTELKGVLAPLPPGADHGVPGGAVLNLSFGISIIDAVRDYALTGADFAVTDLAVEMLYLVEAKTAVMEELRRLNLRLDGAREAAEAQALTDTLTGLGNRRALDLALDRLTANGCGFALMHLDLDHFKAVNDTFGHAAGDHVLLTVAERLRAATRDADQVIRQGGDEFLLVLPSLTDAVQISDLGTRLVGALETPIPYGDDMLRISASIGTSVSTAYDPVDVEQMMEDADIALYCVKERGRHGHLLYTPELGRMAGEPAPQDNIRPVG